MFPHIPLLLALPYPGISTIARFVEACLVDVDDEVLPLQELHHLLSPSLALLDIDLGIDVELDAVALPPAVAILPQATVDLGVADLHAVVPLEVEPDLGGVRCPGFAIGHLADECREVMTEAELLPHLIEKLSSLFVFGVLGQDELDVRHPKLYFVGDVSDHHLLLYVKEDDEAVP